jgi:hypothetical protein
VEVAREEEDWDFFVAPDLDDEAALQAVDAYIRECLGAGDKKKEKKGKSAPQEEAKKGKSAPLEGAKKARSPVLQRERARARQETKDEWYAPLLPTSMGY